MRNRYVVRATNGTGYAVFNLDDERVSLVYRDEIQAHRRLLKLRDRELRRITREQRDCITCSAAFEAQGLFHRMCPRCASPASAISLVG